MASHRAPARLAGYAACAAALAYFSSAPSYEQLHPGAALLRLSMVIPGAPLQPCRPLSASDIERLAPNMRQAAHCPRGRADVRIRLALDDTMLVDDLLSAAGWARDGSATIYRRIVVPEGAHHIYAAVNDDGRQSDFRYVAEINTTLSAGRVLVVDFDREAGGVQFR